MPERWVGALNGAEVAIDDLATVANELLQVAEDARVWLFEGQMGSGKTTLIKVLCGLLGVKGGTSSPTFSIVNEYQGVNGKPIFHFDFYRLEKETEAYDMGVEEYFDSGNYCFVEWPELISGLYPLHYLKVRIKEASHNTRNIEYTLL